MMLRRSLDGLIVFKYRIPTSTTDIRNNDRRMTLQSELMARWHSEMFTVFLYAKRTAKILAKQNITAHIRAAVERTSMGYTVARINVGIMVPARLQIESETLKKAREYRKRKKHFIRCGSRAVATQ